MQHTINRFRLLLLSFFPLFYGLLISPSNSPANIFSRQRVFALGLFLLLNVVLLIASSPSVRFGQLLGILLRQPLSLYLLMLFGGSLLLSSFLSADPGPSWFGTSSTQTGAIFMLLSILLFWLYSSSHGVSRKGLISLLLVLNLLTIAEFLGFRPLAFITDRYAVLHTSFPAVTIGHRGHLGGLLLMFALLPLYWFHGRYDSWKFWTLFILGCIGLGCTTNSAADLGMVVAMLLFLLLHRRQFRPLLLLIPVVALLSMNVYRPLTTVNMQLQRLGLVHVTADAKNLDNISTLKTRLLLWKAAVQMAEARPLVGWGPQTYNMHWFSYLTQTDGDQLFRLEMSLKSSQTMVRINDTAAYKDLEGKTTPLQLNYVAPHNAFLDLLYSQGLIGVLIFCSFCVFLFIDLYRKVGRLAVLGLIPFLAYGIYLLAWFITIPTTGLVVIALGITVAELRTLSPVIKLSTVAEPLHSPYIVLT